MGSDYQMSTIGAFYLLIRANLREAQETRTANGSLDELVSTELPSST